MKKKKGKWGGHREKLRDKGPYEFRGGALELLTSEEVRECREVVFAGPAGTGKSFACLMRMHMCCEAVPGIRCLIVRKTRSSLTESGLVTFESLVLPHRHPALLRGGARMLRQSYVYPNGSEIILGGMDNPDRILSTEYDLCYVQEATELKEEDWETLLTRIGRKNTLPFQQVYGDCNPDAPTHWLKRRCDTGRCKMLVSRHEDNPAFFDKTKEDWTEAGRKYLANLDALTGPRLLRFRHGVWAQAEGVVYPEFDIGLHVRTPEQLGWEGPYPPPDWPRYWGVDFGYTKPLCVLMTAQDHDGRIYVYREIYHTGILVEDHAKRMLDLWRDEASFWGIKRSMPMEIVMKQVAPRAIICDHDAEDRATLERHLGLATTGARKYVRKGIQAVSERFRKAGDGKPRLFFLEGMLDRRDRLLEDKKQPCSTVEEMGAYCWRPEKDEPVKEYDHGCFAAGTLIYTDVGWRAIEQMTLDLRVMTRSGWRDVVAVARTGRGASVVEAVFSDGRKLVVTPDHPVWSVDAEAFVPVKKLMEDESVLALDQDRRDEPLTIVSIDDAAPQDVYNLTVDGCHEYYANGVLAANCDVIRYLTLQLDLGMSGLWETPTFVTPDAYRDKTNHAVDPTPALRWGEDMLGREGEDRRGFRLFGRDKQ